MAIIKIDSATRTAIAQALIASLDYFGASTIDVYDGAMPAGPDEPISGQVLLGTLTCSSPVATVTDGVITFNPIAQDSAANTSGTASFIRIKDASNTARIDLDVTGTAGTGAVKMNTTTIVEGGPISITSAVLTMGGA